MTPEHFCHWLRGVLDQRARQTPVSVQSETSTLDAIGRELSRVLPAGDVPRPAPTGDVLRLFVTEGMENL